MDTVFLECMKLLEHFLGNLFLICHVKFYSLVMSTLFGEVSLTFSLQKSLTCRTNDMTELHRELSDKYF